MSKFNEGDRVEIIGNYVLLGGLLIKKGWQGTITYFEGGCNGGNYWVKFDDVPRIVVVESTMLKPFAHPFGNAIQRPVPEVTKDMKPKEGCGGYNGQKTDN